MNKYKDPDDRLVLKLSNANFQVYGMLRVAANFWQQSDVDIQVLRYLSLLNYTFIYMFLYYIFRIPYLKWENPCMITLLRVVRLFLEP